MESIKSDDIINIKQATHYIEECVSKIKSEESAVFNNKIDLIFSSANNEIQQVVNSAMTDYRNRQSERYSDMEFGKVVERLVYDAISDHFISHFEDAVKNRILELPGTDQYIKKACEKIPDLEKRVQLFAQNPISFSRNLNCRNLIDKKLTPHIEKALTEEVNKSSVSIIDWLCKKIFT